MNFLIGFIVGVIVTAISRYTYVSIREKRREREREDRMRRRAAFHSHGTDLPYYNKEILRKAGIHVMEDHNPCLDIEISF